MSENPYATPQAQSPQIALTQAKAPYSMLRRIAAGWIVGSVMSAFDLLLAVRAFAGGDPIEGSIYGIGTLMVGALAYGTYRRSRIAACLLLVSYVLARLVYAVAGNADGLGIAVLIALAYLSAVRGTFQYHRWLQEQRVPPSHPPRPSGDPLLPTPSTASASAETTTANTTASTPATRIP